MPYYFLSLAAIFAALVLLSVGTAWLFRRLWQGPSLLRSAAMNSALLLLASGFTLLLLELAAYQFIVFPDGFNISLASHRWFARYWDPYVNEWGQRGPMPNFKAFERGPSILFLGDSFTAGSGVEDYHDTFSNQCKEKLQGKWKVETLSGRGWDTDKEFARLKDWPVKPDKIIYQYYLNDIGHAVLAAGREGYRIMPAPLPGPLQWLSDHSYLFNFIHLQVFRAGQLLQKVTFWDNLQSFYKDESLWQAHTQMIDQIVTYCRENNIELNVLIFPNLFAVEESRPITSKVRDFFESRGVKVVDLTDDFAGRDPNTLVVNVTNAHPNAATHHEVADILIKELAL